MQTVGENLNKKQKINQNNTKYNLRVYKCNIKKESSLKKIMLISYLSNFFKESRHHMVDAIDSRLNVM